MEQFSILHEFEKTQFLVDTDFNHESDEYELTMKFWCGAINGFTSIKSTWPAEREEDYKRTFEELKRPEKALKWIEGFEAKYVIKEE
jgi:hypothetical protein